MVSMYGTDTSWGTWNDQNYLLNYETNETIKKDKHQALSKFLLGFDANILQETVICDWPRISLVKISCYIELDTYIKQDHVNPVQTLKKISIFDAFS